MIANFDETMLVVAPRRVQVLAPSDSLASYKPVDDRASHITLGVTIFANGSFANTLAILPLKEFPIDMSEELTESFVWSGQDAGWISKNIFADYCRKILFKKFTSVRALLGDPNALGLLLVDGHSSRGNAELLDEFVNEKIDILCFT